MTPRGNQVPTTTGDCARNAHGSGVGLKGNPELCWIHCVNPSTGLGLYESPIAAAIGLITQNITRTVGVCVMRHSKRIAVGIGHYPKSKHVTSTR